MKITFVAKIDESTTGYWRNTAHRQCVRRREPLSNIHEVRNNIQTGATAHVSNLSPAVKCWNLNRDEPQKFWNEVLKTNLCQSDRKVKEWRRKRSAHDPNQTSHHGCFWNRLTDPMI